MSDDVVVPFDKPKNRYYTRASHQSKETDLISFRAGTTEVRKMDEIAASRVEPELKTRSDIINDAIHTWLNHFLEEHSEDLPSLHDRFQLEHIQHLYDSRQADLDLILKTTDQAIREDNSGVLRPILYNAMRLLNELTNDPFASPKQQNDLNNQIKIIQRKMGVQP